MTTNLPTPLSQAMPELVIKMSRLARQWEDFCEAQRPLVAAVPQAISCREHPEVACSILFEESCQHTHREGRFTPIYAPCPECLSAASLERRNAFWSKRGVPYRTLGATLSNFQTEEPERTYKSGVLAKVKAWVNGRGVFLLMSGSPGTGKGHLATACLKAQGNGIFVTQADMLLDLRASYTLGNTKAVIEHWQEADMLVLDEFGLSVGGKDEEPLLYQVLAYRHDHALPTIITSNKTLQELKDLLGYRLCDRIAERCTSVVMNWPSFRTTKP